MLAAIIPAQLCRLTECAASTTATGAGGVVDLLPDVAAGVGYFLCGHGTGPYCCGDLND